MSNELMIPDGGSLTPDKVNEVFDDVAASNEYLSRIQVMGSNSALVIDGSLSLGQFALINSKEDFLALGKTIDVLVCAFMFKAMDLTADPILTSYDPSDSVFQAIKDRSTVSDSQNLCGLDFLLWLPSANRFVSFYLSSKSARKIAPKMRSYIIDDKVPSPATLTCNLVKGKKFSWHVAAVGDCTTPFDMPSQEEFTKVLNKFQNPPKTVVEEVEAVTTARAR